MRIIALASCAVAWSSFSLAQTSQPSATSGPSEVTLLYNQAVAAYSAKEYDKSIELGLAAIEKGAKKGTVPYHLACCYALTGRSDEAFAWLRRAIERGWTNAGHLKVDTDLNSLHDDPRWAETVLACEKAADEQYAQFKEPKLARELMQRMAEDQRVRFALDDLFKKQPTSGPIMSKEGMSLANEMQKIDRDNTAFMKTVIEKHGWPGKSLVGEEAANAAWLMVQHADLEPKFQERCLDLIKEAFKGGEVTGQQVAYLTDRVLVKQGKKQLYGTQFAGFGNDVKPAPIEDEANVDARRKEVGLSTMAEYERQMKSRGG